MITPLNVEKPYRRRRRKSQLTSGTEVLHRLFEGGDSALSDQFLRWKLWKKWDEVVGASISTACEPVGYFRGQLYLWVKNSSWMHQLNFMKEPLKSKVNTYLQVEYVKDIRFTLNRKDVPEDAQAARDLKMAMNQLIREESDDRTGISGNFDAETQYEYEDED